MDVRSYAARGMTCSRCVAAVEREVSAVVVVAAVPADLHAGQVTLHGHGISDAAVRDAIADAGYATVRA